jgi:lipid-binding SYLF domain-containing protein
MANRFFMGLLGVVAAGLAGCSASPAPLSPDDAARLDLQVTGARQDFESLRPATKTYFEKSYAYAVFPRMTSVGAVVGGAGGHGLVFEGGKQVGTADLTAFNIGATLGGKRFAEVIFFENQLALTAFKSGTVEFDARASAVAANAGTGTAVDYVHGVRVFTIQEGGLMVEAALGGQEFRYQGKP